MTLQGTFTDKHNRFFGSLNGAFTAITEAEINKQTYNIKSVIKNILIDSIGRENIPRTGGSNQEMLFNIWPGTLGLTQIQKGIVCKFSKPNKDEMTIYLSRVIPKEKQVPGDVWFIFFRNQDPVPWFGYMRGSAWDMYFSEGEETETELAQQDTPPLDEEDNPFDLESTDYNLIVFGAPGTGKSHYLKKKFPENKRRVTFHPEYTYQDFVGSYKPVPVYKQINGDHLWGGKTRIVDHSGEELSIGEPMIDYRFVPGPFTLSLAEALRDKDTMYTLIIEELNRANAPAVFGDLFQLLDREEDGNSTYSVTNIEISNYLRSVEGISKDQDDNDIHIPYNLNIVATMNSADQGVYVMDSAFKRRWNFEYLPIRIDDAEHKDELIPYGGENRFVKWGDFIENINSLLSSQDIKINEDKHIGPYFIKPKDLMKKSEDPKKAIERKKEMIANKLLIYLWDDVVRHKRIHFFENPTTYSDLINRYKNGAEVFKCPFPIKLEPSEEHENPDHGELPDNKGEIENPLTSANDKPEPLDLLQFQDSANE